MSYLPGTTYVQLNSNQGASITDVNSNVYTYNSSFPNYTYTNSTTPLNINFSNSTNSINITKVVLGTNVNSIGNDAFQSCIYLASITIPTTVTSIGNGSFFRCLSLTSITIPNSVTIIGSSAFNMSGLISVVIPNSVTIISGSAFQFCNALTYFTIGSGLNNFGGNGLNGCPALLSITVDPNNATYSNYNNDGNLYNKNITSIIQYATAKTATSFSIPTTVTTIGGNAFQSCTALTSITIPSATTGISAGAFKGCSNLSSVIFTPTPSVTNFGSFAFQDCSSLSSINIPASVTNISNQVFQNCTSMTSITVAAGNTAYSNNNGDGNLYNLNKTSLIQYAIGKTDTTFSIPNTVISISTEAFQKCAALQIVTIPTSVTSIGNTVFSNCTKLTSITVTAGNTVYSNNSGDGNLYNLNKTSLIQYAIGKTDTTFTIPNTVNTIQNYAFQQCAALQSVTIPTSVTSIGYLVFSNCTNLTSITVTAGNTAYSNNSGDGNLYDLNKTTLIQYAIGKTDTSFSIPNTVNTIQDCAFQQCAALQTVTIPTSVTSIGRIAVFSNCTKLTSITVTAGNTVYSNNSSDGNLYNLNITTLIQYAIGKTATSFIIPNTVNAIQDYAFQQCAALQTVTVPSTALVLTGVNAFTGISQPATLYTTSANIYNKSLTKYFTNVSLIGGIPTNYYTIQTGQTKDLSEVFAPLTSTSAATTNFLVENYNNTGVTKDLNQIFEGYVSGSQAQTTNFIIENYNGTGIKDLNQIFKPL